MAEVVLMMSPQVAGAVLELDELANALEMPDTERCSILGLNYGAYRRWLLGDMDMNTTVAPELVRRINYALPLMRRMAANMLMLPVGRDHTGSGPPVN